MDESHPLAPLVLDFTVFDNLSKLNHDMRNLDSNSVLQHNGIEEA